MEQIYYQILFSCDKPIIIKISQINKYIFDIAQNIIFNKFYINSSNISNIKHFNIGQTKKLNLTDTINSNSGIIGKAYDKSKFPLVEELIVHEYVVWNYMKNLDLPNIKKLYIRCNNYINDDKIILMSNLTHLKIDVAFITKTGISHLKKLQSLEFENLCLYIPKMIDDHILEQLQNLEHLTVHKNITIDGLIKLPKLISLEIGCHATLKNEDMEQLNNLKKLKLNEGSPITDKGLNYLINIEELDIYDNNKITIKGLRTLSKLKILKRNSYKIQLHELKRLPFYNNIKLL